MDATTHETVFDEIRDKFAELSEQCESGCSQLAGAEARLRTLLGTRRDLMASPGSPFLLAEEISRRSREVAGILTDRQKRRAVIESELRQRLAERRRLASELCNVGARLNEKTWRLEELEARVRQELAEDPHYLGLKGHLRDLEEGSRESGPLAREKGPVTTSKPDAPRASFFSKVLGLAGFRRDTPHPDPESNRDERGAASDSPDERIARVRRQLSRKEDSVKQREGFAALEAQREGLAAKMAGLLDAEDVSRRRCQRLFLDWRDQQQGDGRDLQRAFRELGRCLESQAASPPPGAQVRSQLLRLRELSQLIEAACAENERLARNCDRLFTALERMMELEANFWRGTGARRAGEVDFVELLRDLDLEARPVVKRAEVEGVPLPAPSSSQTQQSPTAEEAPENRRFRQFRLWDEEP